jgi:hypothetical protein
MRYGSIIKATGFRAPDWRMKLVTTALFFIPKANPDHEALFPKVKKWSLELSNEGTVLREVALDEEGAPLFRAPEAKNHGLWTDSNRKFSKKKSSR